MYCLIQHEIADISEIEKTRIKEKKQTNHATMTDSKEHAKKKETKRAPPVGQGGRFDGVF